MRRRYEDLPGAAILPICKTGPSHRIVADGAPRRDSREASMKYVCAAPTGRTWFRLEDESEAEAESRIMRHAVEKYFRKAEAEARASFVPASTRYIEQEIGLRAHIQRQMPFFLTLRNAAGDALATAMLPPGGKPAPGFRTIIVGHGNADPYIGNKDAIEALGEHFGVLLSRDACYPYQRG